MPFLQGNRAQIFSSRVWKPNPGTPINWTHHLSQGIVGLWLFNSAPPPLGLAHDVSGNLNHGTLAGATHSVPGLFGNALDFDGSGDWINCGSGPSLDTTSAVAISLWFKADTLGTNDTIFGHTGDAGNWDEGFGCYYSGGDSAWKFWVDAFSDNVSVAVFTDTTSWHHMVATWDGATVLLYIDTVLAGTTDTYTGTIGFSGSDFYIGTLGAGEDYSFEGQIDHVIMWDRGLSAAEVTELYADPFQMFF